MTAQDPTLTNATTGRFQFGTIRMADQGALFEGAVVFGAGFTYDPSTGFPITGMVHRIEVQTRIADQVLDVHTILPNVATSVQDLNTSYADTQAPWFDATDMFACSTPAADIPNDTDDLHLTTGDILTAKDLKSIANAKDPDPAQNAKPDLDGLDDIVVTLNITAKDIPRDSDLPDVALAGFGDLLASGAR